MIAYSRDSMFRMLKNSRNRILTYLENTKNEKSLIDIMHIGCEMRQIECILDEAFYDGIINSKGYSTLRGWYIEFRYPIVDDIIRLNNKWL